MGLFKRKKKDKDLLMIPMEFQMYDDCDVPPYPPAAEPNYGLQYEMKDLYKAVILTGLGHLVAVDEVVYAANRVLEDYSARFGSSKEAQQLHSYIIHKDESEKFWNALPKEEVQPAPQTDAPESL